MKLLNKKIVFQKNKVIKKNYLFDFILYFKKEYSLWFRKTYLFNIPISFKSLNKEKCKNPFDIDVLFEQKSIAKQECTIDIIIPVYEGFEYLDNLFNSVIQNTDLPYKLYVINDCSQDERILPLLTKFCKLLGSRMELINNSENLGFVKSVNKALFKSKNHVIILNTDVVLPKNWASRLIKPIIDNPTIASVTPFSNAATIFSLPKINENNSFEYCLEKVNSSLGRISTPYLDIKLPTGVGFCMAMNRTALDEIGILDEIYGKGYGEENDWCQRAVKHGYSNTIAANLFVWHKHGGSFVSKEKTKLIQEHSRILKNRYPKYFKSVSSILKNDGFLSIRFIAELLYFNSICSCCEMWFDHCFGGGTNLYLERQFDRLKEDVLCIRIQNNNNNCSTVTFNYKDYSNSCVFFFDDAIKLVSKLSANKIVINNLSSYLSPLDALKKIGWLKKQLNAKVSFRLHDYFSICPSINMINKEKHFCGTTDSSFCDLCFFHLKKSIICDGTDDISLWHKEWNTFFEQYTDEIIVFSKSSLDLLCNFYPSTKKKIEIIPHTVPNIRKVQIPNHNGLNIGILGNITVNKGFNVLKDMSKFISKYKGVNVVVIGSIEKPIHNIRVTGKYNLKDLPKMVEENFLDIILIPSIWPETFSYTTSEAIQMGLPVACFNIGAPRERVSQYVKGLVINKIDGEYALRKIITFLKEKN